jgi:hypothetical protein
MKEQTQIIMESSTNNNIEDTIDDENTDYLTSDTDENEEIIVKKVIKSVPLDNIEDLPPKPVKIKKKYVKKAPKIVSTNDPNINVILKSRNKGKKAKKQIIIYKEDLEDEDDDKPEIIVKSKIRGRPKNKQIIKYVDKNGNEIDNKKNATDVILPLPSQHKDLSEKDIKIIELETRLHELSQISNKTIRATKKNKPDQRQIKPRSDKQIAQAKKLVELNKMKRQEKQNIKDAHLKDTQKNAVKLVISELSNVKVDNEKKSNEIKQQVQQEKKIKEYYNDPLFS